MTRFSLLMFWGLAAALEAHHVHSDGLGIIAGVLLVWAVCHWAENS